jgi:hypothetical protein
LDLPLGCPACLIESAVVRPTRSELTCHGRRAAALSYDDVLDFFVKNAAVCLQ